MNKFIVSTFGKWEIQRQKLFLSLIANPAVNSIKSAADIEKALFDNVNSAMFEIAYDFVRKNISKFEMRALTIQSYQLSLTVVLDSLANALGIAKNILDPAVGEFCEECNKSIEIIVDDILKIGQVSNQAKARALDELYGESFKTSYASLVPALQLQDPELIEIARKAIEATIHPSDFGKNAAIIREQLIYINEVAPQVKPTLEFQALFKATTSLSMEQYKNKIKNK